MPRKKQKKKGLDTLEEVRRAEAEVTWMDHIMQHHGVLTGAQQEDQEEWDPWKELVMNNEVKGSGNQESKQPEEAASSTRKRRNRRRKD